MFGNDIFMSSKRTEETSLSSSSYNFVSGSKAVLLLWIFYVFFLSCVCYAFVHVCLYVPCGHIAGKRLTSWLSFVVSNCEFVTFPLVSWAGVVLDCIDS